jgi:hypothetical protein
MFDIIRGNFLVSFSYQLSSWQVVESMILAELWARFSSLKTSSFSRLWRWITWKSQSVSYRHPHWSSAHRAMRAIPWLPTSQAIFISPVHLIFFPAQIMARLDPQFPCNMVQI